MSDGKNKFEKFKNRTSFISNYDIYIFKNEFETLYNDLITKSYKHLPNFKNESNVLDNFFYTYSNIEKLIESRNNTFLQNEISEIDTQISQLIKKQQALYNPNWGQLMRAGNEESYFAYQMERYACVYMSKIGDLFELSPRTYFRAPRRPLSHEV